ncbi:MAG TPA: hypothetical protein VEL07_22295 [Planctomycetota bacterium]|nr:hypothetical protein [Planctomycetota bacterium]
MRLTSGTPIAVPSARPARERGDPDAERRLADGRPLDAQRVIPSNAPLPLAAQRDFRGVIVLVILGLILVGIALCVLLINRVSGRTIHYAPTAARIGSTSAAREATDWEAINLANLLVARMESWTPATVAQIWASVLPFLHPSLHEKIKSTYANLGTQATAYWQHRVAIPLGASIGGRTAGIITVAVFYDSIELTGRDAQSRRLGPVLQKAAFLQFAADATAKENPLGLVLTLCQFYERDEWLRRGYPDLWDQYRVPAELKAR